MNPVLRLIRNYGVALIVVGVLIWFPFTGFWLTILTLGLLPALICNLFLIHLTCAAWTRRVAFEWLVVPVACYGAWLGWAIWQNNAVSSEKRKLESENHITVPVLQNVTLVFPEGDRLSVIVRQHLASPLRVFVGPSELPIGIKSFCRIVVPSELARRCAVEPSSSLPNDAIVFRRLPDLSGTSVTYLRRYELTQNTATTGDHVLGHFTFGVLRAPVWAPVFQTGCFLIDNPAAWKCDISPMFRKVAVGETGSTSKYYYDLASEREKRAIATLANMLGVEFIEGER